MNPDQTAPLGPYSLRYRLPNKMTKVVTGGKRIKWVSWKTVEMQIK